MSENTGEDGLIPAFALSIFNDTDGVTLTVHTPEDPDIRKHASPGLLYGLAMLTLDREDAVARKVDEILAAGPVNEVDALNRIAALLAEDANVLPV